MESKNKSIIYMARCTINKDLIYIGKTHLFLEDRIIQHEQQARTGDPAPFHQAMIDYGLKNWEWDTLEICDIKDEYKREKSFIKKLEKTTSIELLNVAYKRNIPENKKRKIFSSKIIRKNIAHKTIPREKSNIGKLFTRMSGKLKPVINLKTRKCYQSALEASRTENIRISTLRNCCNSGKMLENGTRYAYLDLYDKPILNEGHKKELYIGDRIDAKKIKNLINGKIYKNSSEVAKEYNISPSSADGAARGKYMTLLGKYVFCFLDKDGKEIITNKHKKGLEKIRSKDLIKYVTWHIDDINMDNLLYFKTLDDLCNNLEIRNKSHVKSVCEGKRFHAENWRIAYFDNNKKLPILQDKHKEKPGKRLRKIICLNDNNIFNSGIEAGRHYGIIASQVTKCAGGGAKSVFRNKERLRFAFLDDDGKPILTSTHKESLSQRGKRRIQIIRSGEIFNSLAEYIRKTNIPYKRAKKYLKDSSIDLLGNEFIEID